MIYELATGHRVSSTARPKQRHSLLANWLQQTTTTTTEADNGVRLAQPMDQDQTQQTQQTRQTRQTAHGTEHSLASSANAMKCAQSGHVEREQRIKVHSTAGKNYI